MRLVEGSNATTRRSRVTEQLVVDLADVVAASARIRSDVLYTPLLASEWLSQRLGCSVWLKAENLQHTGSFKARGATNAVQVLSQREAARGVVTHSSGNHAAALARAAGRMGITAHVVMPHNSSSVKLAAVRSYGIEPVLCGISSDERTSAMEEVRSRTGATLVHPYESPAVIAGQGTVGLEMLEQQPGLSVVFCPVGGGGLLSGLLTAVKGRRPGIRVIAVEPAWADDTFRSLRSGDWQMPVRFDSVADGLRTAVGRNTLPIIRKLLDDIVLVSEQEILETTRELAERVHLVVEPSGAVALAGLKKLAAEYVGQTIGVILSGGNLSMSGCRLGTPPASETADIPHG
jgi:threonine dehydratase